MKKPEYDAVNPLWIRGREWGMAEERDLILTFLRTDLARFASGTDFGNEPDYDRGVRIAYSMIIQQIALVDELI